uniref:phage major tail tube protein n=1 Tax=Escherichia coli TaxID=562 RepID=UPI0015930F13
NLLGCASVIKLQDVSLIMQEHNALGLVCKFELPAGFDKLEVEIKWNSFYQDVLRKTAYPWQAVALQCRSSIVCY